MRVSRRGFIGSSTAFLAVGDLLSADSSVPEWWRDSIAAAARRIADRSRRFSDGFFFFTDLHLPANRNRSGMLIAELMRRAPLKRAVFGGDLPDSWSGADEKNRLALDAAVRQYRELWRDPIEAAGGELYAVKGNHDFTICSVPDKTKRTSCTYSAAEAASVILGTKACQSRACRPDDPAAAYYFVDDDKSCVRYVFVDTNDAVDLKKKWWNVLPGTDKRQLWWLAENAFQTMKEGWSAIVVHHVPVVGVLTWGDEIRRYERLRNLLEAYQNRGCCEIAGRRYDFSSAKGRILLDISGHYHAERQTFAKGILHVCEPCDAAYDRDMIDGGRPWCDDQPKRPGTPFEQSFDAVQFDPSGMCVSFTRIGSGRDRTIHLQPIRMRVGEQRQFAPKEVANIVRWGCYDGDCILRKDRKICYNNARARITDGGLLEARKPGVSMVVGLTREMEKEIFPVEIA